VCVATDTGTAYVWDGGAWVAKGTYNNTPEWVKEFDFSDGLPPRTAANAGDHLAAKADGTLEWAMALDLGALLGSIPSMFNPATTYAKNDIVITGGSYYKAPAVIPAASALPGTPGSPWKKLDASSLTLGAPGQQLVMNAAGDAAVWTTPVQAINDAVITGGNPNQVGRLLAPNPGSLIITPSGVWQATDQVAQMAPGDVANMRGTPKTGWFQVYVSPDANAVKAKIKDAVAKAADWNAFQTAIAGW